MAGLGTYLTVMAGPSIPLPLPPPLGAQVRSVTVTENDRERSAFTIVLDAGRAGPQGIVDSPLMTSTLRANARISLVVTMGPVPTVLMDGIVSEVELTPASASRPAELKVTGHDVSLLMDRHEVSTEHVGLEDSLQVLAIAGPYAADGIVPTVIPPVSLDPPLPIERTPTQQATDWSHIQDLATTHGYVSYMIPGPLPGMSTLYWGPAVRVGLPQTPITVDMGPHTNVTGSPSFREDALGPEFVSGQVQDPQMGGVPVQTFAAVLPPLAAAPLTVLHQPNVRTRIIRESGIGAMTALARAQAITNNSANCVVASGTLDGAKYGAILRPRGLVGMRGAGLANDGLWYVEQAVHQLSAGAFSTAFTISREGYLPTVPALPAMAF